MSAHLSKDAPVTCLPVHYQTNVPLKGIIQARKLLKRLKPDLLITYNWGAIDWCVAQHLLTGLRHIHIEDGFGPEEHTSRLRRRTLFRRLVLSERNTLVVVPSRALEFIALHEWKLSRGSVRYIPNGIDCDRFFSPPRTVSHSGPVVIGTVATLRAEKNISRLIRLFGAVAARYEPGQVKLLIVGDGPERTTLQREAIHSSFTSQITFAGGTRTPEHYLAKMDIFALSSNTEQMPLSVLEAMAASLPIVSFAVGDIKSMVACQNLELVSVPLNEDGKFIEHLHHLIKNAELRRTLGNANQENVLAHFDHVTMAQAYGTLFD
jgi:glycosyltransferase involved in cell wall biosynthesis